MKVLKIIIQVIVITMVVLAIVGWLLPREVEVKRDIVIEAPAEKIFAVANDLKQSSKWSPWFKIDPEGTQLTYEGPDSGVGMKMSWESEHKNVGTGSQEIIKVKNPSLVKTEMYFGGFEEPSYASFYIEEKNGVSSVTWDYQGDMGPNPYKSIVGLFMDSMLGGAYEQGLTDLKNYIEGLPDEAVMTETNAATDSTALSD